MDTERLIRGLASDARLASPRMPAIFAVALAVSGVIAALAFFGMLGPRPDIALAATTPRFLFKFVVTLALATAAVVAAFGASRPGAPMTMPLALLAIPPLLVLAAVVVEFITVSPAEWAARWIGTNAGQCLTFIPLIGIGPLVVLLLALRRGAPTRPRLAGALAGLLAGGLAATFYAAHCTDDSPFFVATWYTLAVAFLTIIGALAGSRALKW
jgi:hypothetical protein